MDNVERVMCFFFTAVLILMQITCQRDVIFKCKNQDCSEPIWTQKARISHSPGKQWQIGVKKNDQIKILGITTEHDQYYVEANGKKGYLPKLLFMHATIPNEVDFLDVEQSVITEIIDKKTRLSEKNSDNRKELESEFVNETRGVEISENKDDNGSVPLEKFPNIVNPKETENTPELNSNLENDTFTVGSQGSNDASSVDHEKNQSDTKTSTTKEELSDRKNDGKMKNSMASETVNNNINELSTPTAVRTESNTDKSAHSTETLINKNSAEFREQIPATELNNSVNESDDNDTSVSNMKNEKAKELAPSEAVDTNELPASVVPSGVGRKLNESNDNNDNNNDNDNDTSAPKKPYFSNSSGEEYAKKVEFSPDEATNGKTNESSMPIAVSEADNKKNKSDEKAPESQAGIYSELNNTTNKSDDNDTSVFKNSVSNISDGKAEELTPSETISNITAEFPASTVTSGIDSKLNESNNNNTSTPQKPYSSNSDEKNVEFSLSGEKNESSMPIAASEADEKIKFDEKASENKDGNHSALNDINKLDNYTLESKEPFPSTKNEKIEKPDQNEAIINVTSELPATITTSKVDSNLEESNDDNNNASVYEKLVRSNFDEKENKNNIKFDEKASEKSEDGIKTKLNNVNKLDNNATESKGPISNEELNSVTNFSIPIAKSEVDDNVTKSNTEQNSILETSQSPEFIETVMPTPSPPTPSIAEAPKPPQQPPLPPPPPYFKYSQNIHSKKEPPNLPDPTPNIDQNESEIKVEIENKSEFDNKKDDSFEQTKTSLQTPEPIESHFKHVENEQVAGNLFSDNQENEKASYEIVLEYLPDLSFIQFDTIVFHDFIDRVKNLFNFDDTIKGTTENELENELRSEQFCGTERLNSFMESNHAVYIAEKKTVLPYWGEITTAGKEQIVWTSGLVSISLFVLILVLVIVNNTKKNNKNKLLITKINRLENKLLVATKEIVTLQEQVKNNEFQVKEKQNTVEIKKVAEAYEHKMNQYKKKATELEDKVSYLEKELENVSTSALEMHKLLENSLATQAQSKSTIDENFVLRSLTETQEVQIEDLRRENNALVTENQCLREDNDVIKTSLKKLEKDYNAQIKKNLELTEKNRDLTLQLDKEIENGSALESNYKSRIYQLRAKLEDVEMNFKRSEFQVQELNRAFLDRQEGKAPEEVQVLCDDMQLKIQVSTLEAMNVELSSQLKEEKNARRMLEDHVGDVIKELNNLKKTYEISEKERSEAVTKLQVLTDYFKDKETQLHKELESKEKLNSERESKDQMLSQKLASMREEINNLKIQNDELKKEILDQESSYKVQLGNAEQKTREHWFASRQSERKYKESQQEAASLRNKILLLETNLSSVSQKSEDKNNSGMNEDLPSMIYRSPLSSDLIPYPSPSEFIPPPPSPIADHSPDFFPPEPIYSPDERLPPLGGRRAPSPPTGMVPDEDEFSVPPPPLIMYPSRNREPPTSSYNRRTPPPNNRHRPQFKSRVPRSSIDSPSSGMSIESLDKSGR